MNSGDQLELEITGLVYGGDAFGRLADGRAAFVPFSLPGELVLVRILEEKRGHVRGQLVKVLRPAPERIAPLCRHFTVCGNCHYQHMDYSNQLKAKETIFREQLQRIAGIANPPVQPIVPSPLAWNYRNNVQFHHNAQGKLGYLEASSDRVVAIEECHLPEKSLNEIWPQVDLEPIPGLNRIDLRSGADNEVQLILESSSPLPDMEFELDMPISAVHLGPDGPVVLAGDQCVIMQIKDRLFQVSPGAFFQVNTAQAAQMVDHILANLPLTAQSTVLDLYCGVGLFSAFLAEKVNHLIGVEVSVDACEDFSVNLDAFENVDLYMGAAEEILPALNKKADIVLVDPPRAGLGRQVMDALIAMSPAYIAYISCDPATLARDLKRLIASGYQLEKSTPFDLFPQTYHIESVSFLRKS
jgi:23S rRNA (uracil1939-C5)-methyltransferase